MIIHTLIQQRRIFFGKRLADNLLAYGYHQFGEGNLILKDPNNFL